LCNQVRTERVQSCSEARTRSGNITKYEQKIFSNQVQHAASHRDTSIPHLSVCSTTTKIRSRNQGGEVIDPHNGIDAVRDVGIRDHKIAAIEKDIPATDAAKTIDARGLIVAPGLVDLHTHVYAGTGRPDAYDGDHSVYPDGFSFRSCVTTMVDAGSSGWRNFPDFKTVLSTGRKLASWPL